MIRRFFRAFFARTRESYSVAQFWKLGQELERTKAELAETSAGLRVAECENKKLWLLCELHESRIEAGLCLNHRRIAEAKTNMELAQARPEDLLP